MILILTYHKVVATVNDDNGFYTITRDALQQQLATLQTRGYRYLGADELLSNGPPPPNSCLMTFDDGTEDHYGTVLPLLQKHNVRGVFFVCSSKFDLPGYLTRHQIQEIAQQGHIIGCHAHQNHRLDQMTTEEIHEQITRCHRVITEVIGTPPVMFAPPGGYADARVRAEALAGGMKMIRTLRWGYNDRPNLSDLESIPLNRYVGSGQFNDILDRRRALAMTVLYQLKQTAKALLPHHLYEVVRKAVGATIHGK